jgi:hypothetical protein
MDSVSKENVEHILKERDDTKKTLITLKGKTIQSIWLDELAELEQSYGKYKTLRETIQGTIPEKQATKHLKKKAN